MPEPRPQPSSDELDAVAELLAAEAELPMPREVADRLEAVLAAEAAAAEAGESAAARAAALRAAAKRTDLGTFGQNPASERKDFSAEARHRVAAQNRARHSD
ncbi:hypothetical protein [Naumannella cuiyingiana]|uniref:Uncharacterized protein n=1 Tax=Naumannella cuiyingiana TaxID=1347891 RepID=A0A7Z0D8Q5_9ACTN|nr:hypothetical protein [Naumannella cuiyingiana]NYI71020.1 hypothetical protein [Naumannella cuiyingiana]